MANSSFDCPTCGAPITEMSEDSKTVKCPYCDSVFENPLMKSESNESSGVTNVGSVTNVNVIQQSVVVGASAPAAVAYSGAGASVATTPSPKSSKVTQLLCDFLGPLGIHRFYAGKIGTGIIWLLTLGCFFIGWIVDALMISMGGFKDKDGRPILNENITVDKSDPRQKTCKNCDAKVTGSLVRCPSCGAGLRSWWETAWGTVIIIAVLFIIFMVFGVFSGGSSPKS